MRGIWELCPTGFPISYIGAIYRIYAPEMKAYADHPRWVMVYDWVLYPPSRKRVADATLWDFLHSAGILDRERFRCVGSDLFRTIWIVPDDFRRNEAEIH